VPEGPRQFSLAVKCRQKSNASGKDEGDALGRKGMVQARVVVTVEGQKAFPRVPRESVDGSLSAKEKRTLWKLEKPVLPPKWKGPWRQGGANDHFETMEGVKGASFIVWVWERGEKGPERGEATGQAP